MKTGNGKAEALDATTTVCPSMALRFLEGVSWPMMKCSAISLMEISPLFKFSNIASWCRGHLADVPDF